MLSSPLTRAWELALGALIAVAGTGLRRVPRSWAAIMSWVGLAAIVTASLTLTSSTVYPGALVAIPVVGAGLVIAGGAAEPSWGAERLLRVRPFQLWVSSLIRSICGTGRSSSLPRNTRRHPLPVWDNVGLLLIAAVAAIVTYLLVENPIRHSKFLIGRRFASIVLGACLVGATVLLATYEIRQPTIDLGSIATATSGSACHSPAPSVVSALRARDLAKGNPGPRDLAGPDQSVLLVGDSTACTLLPGLQAVGPAYGMQFQNGAVIGCGIVSGELAPANEFGSNVVAYTRSCQGEANGAETAGLEHAHPGLVVWASTDERNSIVVSTSSGGKILNAGSAEWTRVLAERMDARVQKFISSGAKVIMLLEPPEVHSVPGANAENVLQLLNTAAAHGAGKPDAEDAAYADMNTLLRKVAAKYPRDVAVVDLQTRVCKSGPPCPYVVDGYNAHPSSVQQVVRPDGIHYLADGSRWVAQWLVPRIKTAAQGLT